MAPTLAPGHTLARRYRIVELLGEGRTAEVYLADDLSLHRRVVVKVLAADLAAHEEIRRMFRDHIVRAATLSHTHLARVFDGGQESGSIFMICEYLSGGSLEDVLRTGRRLSVDDGARLGRDVASALGYVHESGFVLGSLSPSKLLFDHEGRVRVSDVALAGIGDGLRERLSLDDVRYLSPEQALGEPATNESDVYALALILFEAVTGSAAFEGTTPETILQARLNAPLPVRLELGTLDMILAQAAVPDPRLRLDAEQLSARLGAVVGDVAPLVVHPGAETTPLLAQFERQAPRNSIGFTAPSPDQITGGVPVSGFAHAPRRLASPDSAPRGPSGPLGRTPRFDASQYESQSRPPRRGGFLIAALVIVIVAVAAGVIWKGGFFKSTDAVPNLVGQDYTQAANSLKGTAFAISIDQSVRSATVAVNQIVSQVPAAGAKVKSGTTIRVDVSSGPNVEVIPSGLVGKTCAKATAALAAVHVKATCPAHYAVYSSSVASGDVARLLYNKKANPVRVPREASVVLSLSKGPAPSTTTTTTASTVTTTTTVAGEGARAVPNVVGDTQSEVYAAFKKAALYFSTRGPNSNSTKWTTVVSESPPAGTMVAWHSYVTLSVK